MSKNIREMALAVVAFREWAAGKSVANDDEALRIFTANRWDMIAETQDKVFDMAKTILAERAAAMNEPE